MPRGESLAAYIPAAEAGKLMQLSGREKAPPEGEDLLRFSEIVACYTLKAASKRK